MNRAILLAALAAFAVPAAPALADDERETGRLEVSRAQALRIAAGYGMVRVTEIEREDGGWEIEGRDHRGRQLQITIDGRGRVTSVRRTAGDDDEDD